MRGHSNWSRLLWGAYAVSVLTSLSAQPSAGATIVVDTAQDTADSAFAGNGACGGGGLAQLPGADNRISLREAIVATNNSPGPHSITFLETLRDATIRLDFDGDDAGSDPDPLPWLCGGGVTIDADLDDDGAPDVSLNGAGLPASAAGLQVMSSNNQIIGLGLDGFPGAAIQLGQAGLSISGNRVAGNVIRSSATGVALIADSTGLAGSGVVTDIVVSRNRLETTTGGDGIAVIVGPAATSMVQRLSIVENQVSDAARHGIALLLGAQSDGLETSVLDSLLRANIVSGSGREGIAVRAAAGRSHAVRGLVIADNQVRDNGGAGIALGNVCGTQDSVIEATIEGNQLTDNGRTVRLPGIALVGGSNFDCVDAPPAEKNRLTATADGNRFENNSGGHLVVLGGQIGANQNMVAVTLSHNVANDAGLVGIGIIGGQGAYEGRTAAANRNSVRAALSNNDVQMTLGGILLSGGGGGPSNDNHVELIMEFNRSCANTISDISCLGAFPGGVGFPANEGSGNVVAGSIRDSEASVIVADAGVPGNSCSALLENNRACGAPTPTPTVVPSRCVGDCDAMGGVTVDEIIRMVNVALGSLPVSTCLPGDSNRDGMITIEEIVIAVNRALLGC